MATKERLAAMAASRSGVCSGSMAGKFVEPDPNNASLELRTYECEEFRTYECEECGHGCTYGVDASLAYSK
jgi:hypothetical protein